MKHVEFGHMLVHVRGDIEAIAKIVTFASEMFVTLPLFVYDFVACLRLKYRSPRTIDKSTEKCPSSVAKSNEIGVYRPDVSRTLH